MALLGMGDVHYNVCSSCGVLEVPWIHSGTLLRTILDYVGYIITELHGHLADARQNPNDEPRAEPE